MYEGYFIADLTWFPPLLAQRKFVELMFDDDAVVPDRPHDGAYQFKREITSIECGCLGREIDPPAGQKVTEAGREVT